MHTTSRAVLARFAGAIRAMSPCAARDPQAPAAPMHRVSVYVPGCGWIDAGEYPASRGYFSALDDVRARYPGATTCRIEPAAPDADALAEYDSWSERAYRLADYCDDARARAASDAIVWDGD